MKINLTRSIVLTVFGIACFVVSLFPKDVVVEKWSSFLFGFSFPLIIGGIISLVVYYRKQKADAIN